LNLLFKAALPAIAEHSGLDVRVVARPLAVPGALERDAAAESRHASFVPGTFNVGYGYDAASNRTSMTDPQNAGTTYVYDTLNRLSSLTSPQGAFGFSYDALSRRAQLTRPNVVATTYSYDSASRLLSVLHKFGNTILDGTGYTLDAIGNRSSQTNQASGVTSNFTYDPAYQLTQVVQGLNTTEDYSYDAVGNRLSSLNASPYVYNSSKELTSDPSATPTTTMATRSRRPTARALRHTPGILRIGSRA